MYPNFDNQQITGYFMIDEMKWMKQQWFSEGAAYTKALARSLMNSRERLSLFIFWVEESPKPLATGMVNVQQNRVKGKFCEYSFFIQFPNT